MDDKLRILLCEDDENLGMLLREYLQAKEKPLPSTLPIFPNQARRHLG